MIVCKGQTCAEKDASIPKDTMPLEIHEPIEV